MTTTAIDLLDPDLHASERVLDVFDEVRAAAPVAWTRGRRGRGYWSVTGLREIVDIARDAETFTSWWGTRPEVLRAEDAFRLAMIGSGGSVKVFWSNGLVGTITTLAITLLFWPVIDRIFASFGRKESPARA